jgi:hypothetical protein
MITVTKSTKAEIKSFNAKEWVVTDVKHYRKGKDWKEEVFVFKALKPDHAVIADWQHVYPHV